MFDSKHINILRCEIFKIDRQHWPLLKTILVYLHFMPEEDLTDIKINQNVMAELGTI